MSSIDGDHEHNVVAAAESQNIRALLRLCALPQVQPEALRAMLRWLDQLALREIPERRHA
jgi:hypothetical protein